MFAFSYQFHVLSYLNVFPYFSILFPRMCVLLFIKSIFIIIPPSTWATPLTERWCGHSFSILSINHTIKDLMHWSPTSFSFLTICVQLISKPVSLSCWFTQCQPNTRDAVNGYWNNEYICCNYNDSISELPEMIQERCYSSLASLHCCYFVSLLLLL